MSSEFSKWLAGFECVYSNKSNDNKFAYYFEGSVKNYDSSIFALPSGIRALESQRYFVGDDDNEVRLDTICKSLRLRGVECSET